MTLKTTLLSTIILSTSTFSCLALVADVEAGVVKNVVNISEYDSFAADYPIDYSLMNDQINSKKKIYSKPISTDISARAPATGIQYFEIYGVGSTTQGFEYPQPSASITTLDHGSSQIRVAVLQYGYGNVNDATLSGQTKSPTETENICGTLNVDVHICTPGETVTGLL
ncbi:DUF4879 domain-containing protein [Pseudoalteromonas sp.]|uniref:DUF4879 domain-containing protein n=1 Tax=Pseudoalteromonas sp. TaxID=53249 RepID=UPI001BCBB51E|nr:DUF4879 domain-containing protein [Pseudoalteromonas sp.]